MRSVLQAFCLLLLCHALNAQITPCTTPGQNPSTAFPVCGTSVFTQNTVPLCGGRDLPSPNCAGQGLQDRNPFWYKFTCFQTGTLGFVITPNNMTSDYDWEVYDVTGVDPNTVFTNGSLVVASNWSGETGITGASNAGNSLFVCAGAPNNLFSRMPTITAGRNYLLLVSHFTPSQAGYKLEFKGGTAVITDSNIPALQNAAPNCGGDVVRIKINKKIKCSSLAANGSDFFITPTTSANIISATGFECATKFDTDSIELKLDRFLPPGNYILNVKAGSDGNTLLDYCDNAMKATDTASFTVLTGNPTPLDSIAPYKCAPRSLQLVFSKPITCASVSLSDFRVTGPYPVTVTAVSTSCNSNGTTKGITVSFTQPIEKAGNFQLVLQRGSDGNTLLDECGTETPVGSAVPFTILDTVNANFTYNIDYRCTEDLVDFFHPGGNGVNSWLWNMDDNFRSTQQSPRARYTVFGTKNIELIVSNGFCSDTAKTSFVLENFLEANFSVIEDNCPNEPVLFTSSSKGKIVQHAWNFGDGGTATGANATHVYSRVARETTFNVVYTVTDSFGCSKSIQKPVKIYNSCVVDVPNAFTPGKSTNYRLYPMNAVKADQLEFRVYNRWGQLVFSTTNWKQGWDGRLNGQPQPTGTYVWMLRYVDRDTKKLIQKKGYTLLVR